jgi:hypothetical protein
MLLRCTSACSTWWLVFLPMLLFRQILSLTCLCGVLKSSNDVSEQQSCSQLLPVIPAQSQFITTRLPMTR